MILKLKSIIDLCKFKKLLKKQKSTLIIFEIVHSIRVLDMLIRGKFDFILIDLILIYYYFFNIIKPLRLISIMHFSFI